MSAWLPSPAPQENESKFERITRNEVHILPSQLFIDHHQETRL